MRNKSTIQEQINHTPTYDELRDTLPIEIFDDEPTGSFAKEDPRQRNLRRGVAIVAVAGILTGGALANSHEGQEILDDLFGSDEAQIVPATYER